jgi:hypothetical protein
LIVWKKIVDTPTDSLIKKLILYFKKKFKKSKNKNILCLFEKQTFGLHINVGGNILGLNVA